MPTAWVLTKEYSDHSAYTVVRVYLDEARANEDLDLVQNDHCMEWKLHKVDYFEKGENDA